MWTLPNTLPVKKTIITKGNAMTLSQAKKLKPGDKVVIKMTNSTIIVAEIKEKSDCTGMCHRVEIIGVNGGCWTHKQIRRCENE